MKKLFFLFFLAFMTISCTRQEEITHLPDMKPVSVITSPAKKEEYDMYYQSSNYILSTYEPDEGCYLGAYILSNKKINFDMKNLDRTTGKNHGVYMYNMNLQDLFPSSWVLSCLSAMKTPYFVLNPPNQYNPFDKELIDAAAESFGEFYIPMFVEFYPDPQGAYYDPEEYLEFFRYARSVFAKKASNVAFVWAVDAQNVMDSGSFYPGDRYTDWVGLHVYDTIVDGKYENDVFHAIEYFYYTYQKVKPIAVSQLAVSHYSSSDHMYRITEAAAEIERIYDRIITDYPRIKLINYMDFNGMEVSPDKDVQDNFTITELGQVLDAYKKVISRPEYLTEIAVSTTGDINPQLMRSPFKAYKINDAFFVSEKSFRYDLNILGLKDGREINDESYYDLSFVVSNDIGQIKEDPEKKRITVIYEKD